MHLKVIIWCEAGEEEESSTAACCASEGSTITARTRIKRRKVKQTKLS